MYQLEFAKSELEVSVEVIESIIYYSVKRHGNVVLEQSKMGILLGGHEGVGVECISCERASVENSWNRVWGKSSAPVDDVYEEMVCKFRFLEMHLVHMNILIRCYADGMGFRYELPEQEHLEYVSIVGEETTFQFKDNHTVWFSDDGTLPFSNDGPDKLESFQGGLSPLTIKIGNEGYVCLHEADVYRSEVARYKVGKKKNELSINATSISKTPHVTPWRVILVCDSLQELIASNTMDNLNPPCEIEDTSWIRTGKSMWDWRSDGAVYPDFTYTLNTESMKRYIDFAAKNSVQYLLIDGNWHPDAHDIHKVNPLVSVEGIDIREVCEYGIQKGIGIWLYINDESFVYLDIDMILATYESWGVVGIKHGFLASRGQRRSVDTYKMAKKCAKYHLLYNPHEPERPWGMHRTLPNMVSTEFVNAQYDGPGRPEATPTAVTTFPFTNCLAAPIDRSCGMFDMEEEMSRAHCTRKALSTVVAQMAQCMTLFTGLLTLPDNPHAYDQKKDLFEFIKNMPSMSWDETILVNGEISQYITMARRSGEEWFIGSETNEEGRSLSFAADFLGEGEYEVTIYEDGEDAHYIHNRESYQIRRITLKKGESVTMNLMPGGGCVLWMRKKSV